MVTPSAPRRGITDRHVDVLRLAARGKTNKQIGQTLWLTENSVKTHLKRIFHVFGVNTRTEAVLEAHKRGLLTEPRPPGRRDSRGPGRRPSRP